MDRYSSAQNKNPLHQTPKIQASKSKESIKQLPKHIFQCIQNVLFSGPVLVTITKEKLQNKTTESNLIQPKMLMKAVPTLLRGLLVLGSISSAFVNRFKLPQGLPKRFSHAICNMIICLCMLWVRFSLLLVQYYHLLQLPI